MNRPSYTFLWVILSTCCVIAGLSPSAVAGNVPGMIAIISDSTSSDCEGLVIDSIAIENRNVYDTDDDRYSGLLFRTANRLHVVTRSNIVKRELLFAVGELFSLETARETARNLRTRFPFNDAWIETEILSDNRLLVRIITIDQWSLIGGIKKLEREGNELDVQLGFEERNLLGRAQFLSFDYYIRGSDDNYVTTSFRDSRMWGRPFRLRVDYSSNPHGRLKRLTISRPLYNLSERFSFTFSVADASARREPGHQQATWRNKADRAGLSLGYRFGPSNSKLSVSGSYRYLYEIVRDKEILDPKFSDQDFPQDSVLHRFGVSVDYALQKFIVVRRINGFDYNEDVQLGLETHGEYGRAYEADFNDHHYDMLSGGISLTERILGNIVSAQYDRSFWYKGSTDIRRRSAFGLKLYNNRCKYLTVALRSVYISDKSGEYLPLDLGGKNGLRGFDTEHTSGDRLHVMNIEGRFYPGVEILSVKVGGVVFSDIGRSWGHGKSVEFRNYYSNLGVGLRLSLERLSRGELIRIDAVRTDNGDWELSIGSGQYF